MELIKVEDDRIQNILQSTLKTLFSEEETNDLIEGLLLELEEGSQLYMLEDGDQKPGFLILTPLMDEDENVIEMVSVEDIFIKPNKKDSNIADALAKEMKKLAKEYGTKQTEVIISQGNSWISEALVENGYISSEVKLEKLLPRTNNLDDVLELIQDCTPIDRIVQVLLEKEDGFRAEFVDTSDEISDLIDEGWEPVMVVVTYEPDTASIEDQIENSNRLINWDDYSIVYYG
ncbi:MAG: hypothetical protein ACXAE3_13740 [Candidatus Kariarchaeaceae archaeon]|jgi:hypothetical protein